MMKLKRYLKPYIGFALAVVLILGLHCTISAICL